MGKDNRDSPNLEGSSNYKRWARNMKFALQDAMLLSYVNDTRKMPPLIIKKDDKDDPKLQKMIRKRDEKRANHQRKVQSAVDFIGRSCHLDELYEP